MARRSLFSRFIDKAQAALVAAIEIYNKPKHEYREESFALLAINAWELLLKARVLQINNNDLRSILVYSTKKKKSGSPGTKRYLERNASGTCKTITLQKCITKLETDAKSNLALEVRNNLLALSEIRDSSAHFITASPVLRGQVLAVSMATVKNFVLLAKEWFGLDLAEHLSLVLPLAFLSPGTAVDSVVVNSGEGQLIEYLLQLAQLPQNGQSDYDVALKVDVRLKRSNLSSATKVQVVDDPSATPVVMSEENILEAYPWTFNELGKQLHKRYSDFSMNAKYHSLRKPLSQDIKYSWIRLLDPRNPKGGKKQFFSQSILGAFDKHYTRK